MENLYLDITSSGNILFVLKKPGLDIILEAENDEYHSDPSKGLDKIRFHSRFVFFIKISRFVFRFNIGRYT